MRFARSARVSNPPLHIHLRGLRGHHDFQLSLVLAPDGAFLLSERRQRFGPLNRDRFIFLLLFYPIWGCILLFAWTGFIADEIFFPGYRKQPVEKPLFIVSNFRSGSTFVQRTLARDQIHIYRLAHRRHLSDALDYAAADGGLLARLDALLAASAKKRCGSSTPFHSVN